MRFLKLTMNSQHVRLNDILISNCVTSIISSMYQLYFCQIETAIVEHADLSNEKSYCWSIIDYTWKHYMWFVCKIFLKKLFIITSGSFSVSRSAPFRCHTKGGGGVPVTSHLISTLSPTLAEMWFTSRDLSRDTTETPMNDCASLKNTLSIW